MNLSQASTSSILDILSIISKNKQKVISFLQQFFPLNKNIYKKSKNYFFNKCFNSLILSLIIKDLSSFESAPPLRAQASDFVNINCPMTRLCARRSFPTQSYVQPIFLPQRWDFPEQMFLPPKRSR